MATRSLRSKHQTSGASNLFEFDYINEYIHKDKPIHITKTKMSKPVVFESKPLSSKPPPIIVKPTHSPRKSKLRDDPLDDSVYESFHKQMSRRESRMANIDRIKLISDVDILINQKHQLQHYNWMKILPTITKINDPNDSEEMELKRSLTLTEIERRLMKFHNWKKRLEILKETQRTQSHPQPEPSYDEYSIPLDVLRQRRVAEAVKKFKHPIKLLLNNGYYLLIDPKSSPMIKKETIEKPSRSERSALRGLRAVRSTERSSLKEKTSKGVGNTSKGSREKSSSKGSRIEKSISKRSKINSKPSKLKPKKNPKVKSKNLTEKANKLTEKSNKMTEKSHKPTQKTHKLTQKSHKIEKLIGQKPKSKIKTIKSNRKQAQPKILDAIKRTQKRQ